MLGSYIVFVLYSSMINDNKTKDSDMKLKKRTRAGLRLLYNLSMYDTNDLLYSNHDGKTRGRKVSYRAKYKGNFNGGGCNGTGSRNSDVR
jgi:hypothetical protein